jgi:hypothetical protein
MQLTLTRTSYGPESTEGTLTIDSDPLVVVTLEPFARPAGAPKVQNKTAIPAGTYDLTLYPSPHLSLTVPLLKDVPGFEYVEIHPGNSDVNTDGCILIGESVVNPDWISDSKMAWENLMRVIQVAVTAGECSITILDGDGAP